MKTHSQGVMTKPPLTPPTPTPSHPPVFVRISDRDLTEIELHSVDSINDLHRIHSEQSVKGSRPPRPLPPTTNGSVQFPERPVVNQTHDPGTTHWRNQLQESFTTSRWQYSLSCVAIIMTLLTFIIIFSFLVQQGGALTALTDTVKEQQAAAQEISTLIQELQALRRNLTAVRGTQ